MARDSDRLAGSFESENTGGILNGFLAEEDDFDRRSLWRLGSWAVGAVGAVIVALMANQSSLGVRREQVAAAGLARQSQQIQSVAKESQNEARRLASAIDTLNGDRDRLYSRITVLEQGLDSVTGSIARQNSATASPQAAPTPSATAPSASATAASAKTEPPSAAPVPAAAPIVAPVASAASPKTAVPDKQPPTVAAIETGPVAVVMASRAPPTTPTATPATPLIAPKSMMAPPDAAAGKLIAPDAPPDDAAATPAPEVLAAAPSTDDAKADAAPATAAVQRTEFGVDVGTANSVGGLRNLWRGLLKSKSNSALAALRPIIVVKDGSAGMQLRLVAGPLSDAAAAAKICAAMIEHQRTCETTVFDGQQLAMREDDAAAPARSAWTKPAARHRSFAKRVMNEEPSKPPESPTAVPSFFGRR
jgi:hypothetical protein